MYNMTAMGASYTSSASRIFSITPMYRVYKSDASPEQLKNCHFFNAFFYKMLTRDATASINLVSKPLIALLIVDVVAINVHVNMYLYFDG